MISAIPPSPSLPQFNPTAEVDENLTNALIIIAVSNGERKKTRRYLQRSYINDIIKTKNRRRRNERNKKTNKQKTKQICLWSYCCLFIHKYSRIIALISPFLFRRKRKQTIRQPNETTTSRTIPNRQFCMLIFSFNF